jgi:protein OPY2
MGQYISSPTDFKVAIDCLSDPFNFKYKRGCVECPDTAPSCPVCPSGYACQAVVRSCDTCQSTTCAVSITAISASATPIPSASSSPNVGAIAGGVVGGTLAIILVTYLVWRFCIKNKRQQYEETWVEFQDEPSPQEKEFAAQRDVRASTHTVHSITSSILTRASNIIQIAYIPGVTNRSAPSTPGLLVPPIPPIPIALASPSSRTYEDQHFFMPGDLRDSTYSGMTDRTSYARTSVASTIYGKNAIVSPAPAQTAFRVKAAVVSVKSSGANTPADQTPPVPHVDWSKYNPRGAPASPAFSVGSTFLNNAGTANATAATQSKPQGVRVESSGTGKSKLSHTMDDHDSRRTLVDGRNSVAITLIEDTPAVEQGPFVDPPARAAGHTRDGSLSAVIEEATKKAQDDVRGGLGLKRENSPFGDEHATDQ